jgi:hypothetical protein
LQWRALSLNLPVFLALLLIILSRAMAMPSNGGLYNQDTSGNFDTFDIQDLNDGGRIIASPTIEGGQTYYFGCKSDDQGFGKLNIRNRESTWVHFDFVRDDAILNM